MNTGYSTDETKISDVLIVEDDPVQREEMAGYLTRVGLSVTVAPNCAAALAGATVVRPKVIVIDYNLPDGTGLHLAEKMRVLLPRAAIMLASARVEGLSEETLDRIRISVFLNKPLPLQAWRQAVLRLVKDGPSANQERSWLSAGLGSPRPLTPR